MNRARGFTLVEALVAMLVMSAGLLGAWALQIVSLQGHSDALRRTQAMQLAQDMLERIRTNPAGREFYDTRVPVADATCPLGTPSDAQETAVADVAQFLRRARALFPGEDAPAAISFEPAIGTATTDHFTVTVGWRGPRDPGSVTLHLVAQPVAG